MVARRASTVYRMWPIVVVITYKFLRGGLRGILLMMHDKSADRLFHLAISANFDCFSLVPAKVTGKSKPASIRKSNKIKNKNDFYISFIKENL